MPGGKFPLDVRITAVRALTKEDVGRLSEPRFVHPTKRLRQSHHQLALLDALGFKTAEISKLTGYSESRVFTLRADPAFQMIVAEKSKAINEAAIREAGDLMAQKARIMAAMDRHILDHIDQMDEAGELVPLKTALAVSADMADRVGYAKHTTHTAFDGDWAKKLEDRIAMRPRRTLDFMGKLTETRPPQVVEAEPSKRSGSESPSPPRVPLRLITPNITRR